MSTIIQKYKKLRSRFDFVSKEISTNDGYYTMLLIQRKNVLLEIHNEHNALNTLLKLDSSDNVKKAYIILSGFKMSDLNNNLNSYKRRLESILKRKRTLKKDLMIIKNKLSQLGETKQNK